MDTTQLALLALAAGLLIGLMISVSIVVAARVRHRARIATRAHIPEGARALVEAMEDPALIVDSTYTVRAVSPAVAAYHLVVGEAIVLEQLREITRQARDYGPAATEIIRMRQGGQSADARVVAVRAVRVTNQLMLLTLRDITERERIERMRRDFVTNTSHELKTPVAAVSLLAEAISAASDDPDRVREFASRLSGEAARLSQLTARILNLARLQNVDEAGDMEQVWVDDVIAAAVNANALHAETTGVQVIRGGESGLTILGDEPVLVDAMSNLITNAIAHSPRGSKVGVGVRLNDNIVEISVVDRGVGIPEAEQGRVFERFYRADQARSRSTGGTGLGLSIVKHAMQRHGGDVRLWSRPGSGSTFMMRLPAVSP